MISSRSLRSGFFDGDRYRFLASCCVMVLPPREHASARPVELERFLQLLEIDALVLPERIVFGDEHGALEVRRDPRRSSTHCWTRRGVRPLTRASRAQLHERRGGRIRGTQRTDVRKREIGVDDVREADGDGSKDAAREKANHETCARGGS